MLAVAIATITELLLQVRLIFSLLYFNNFHAALVEGRGSARGELGIASMDLQTSAVAVCQLSDSSAYTRIRAYLSALRPVEVRAFFRFSTSVTRFAARRTRHSAQWHVCRTDSITRRHECRQFDGAIAGDSCRRHARVAGVNSRKTEVSLCTCTYR